MRLAGTMRLGSLAVVALILSTLAVLSLGHRFAGPALAGVPQGAMAVDCDASAPGVQATCGYPSGATFSIQVHVTAPPPGGYFAFQAKPAWTDAVLQYLPAADPADEALWADCTIPARLDNQPGEPSVLFGCVPFPLPAAGKMTTGAVLQFQFQCQADGTSPIDLVPRPGDPQNGSQFIDATGNPLDPALTGASVECGAELPPTATPTVTSPPGPPGPPRPTATATAAAAPAALPPTGGVGGFGDGRDSSSLWLLIGSLVAVSIVGLAALGWRYARR